VKRLVGKFQQKDNSYRKTVRYSELCKRFEKYKRYRVALKADFIAIYKRLAESK